MSSTGQTKAGNLIIEGNLITDGFKMLTGAEADKVLTTDASGIASWQTPAGGSLWTQTGDDIYYNTGNVGIGTTDPSSSAKVDISSTNSGFLIPRMTTSQRDAISSSAEGLLIFNTTTEHFQTYYSANWHSFATICDPQVTFTYKGSTVTYGVVEHNGVCWLDRNLGASQVATAYNDANAYGDLFQWGRLDDGHQTRTSETTATLSSSDNPGHSNFILAPSSPYDWLSPENSNLWQGASGTNNPCPSGWRVPTQGEWVTERASWSSDDRYGAYASPLRLPVGGYRYYNTGGFNYVNSGGYFWSSTTFSFYKAYVLQAFSGGVSIFSGYRAYGFSVRCIKD